MNLDSVDRAAVNTALQGLGIDLDRTTRVVIEAEGRLVNGTPMHFVLEVTTLEFNGPGTVETTTKRFLR